MFNRTKLLGTVALAALTLTACGGGGGGGPRPTPAPPISPAPSPAPAPAPTPPPPPPATVSNNTAEYRRSNGAAASGAITAYDRGVTGAGIKVGVIDTGISTAYGDFSGKIDPASADTAGSRGVSDEDGHGTAVSAIIAAAKNDVDIHGVAYGSTIVSIRADNPGSCLRPGDEDDCEFNDSSIAQGINIARQAGARVINLSLGGGGAGSAVLNAVGQATANGVIIVVSAGNDGEDPEKNANPDGFATSIAQRGNGLVIIAGSVGVPVGGDPANGTDRNQLSAFSNRAGSAAQVYLTALGYRVIAPDGLEGNRLFFWSGTSFSAPVISGAVALMAQGFPNLTGQQIVDILFRTADDLGAAGADATFGRGRLNIERAFQPVGTATLAGSSTAISLSNNGALPPASGDARPAGGSAVILDEYQRPFGLEVGRTVARGELDDTRLTRALGGTLSRTQMDAGPVALSLTVAERNRGQGGVGLAQLGLTREDMRSARLLAGRAVARLGARTAVALGFSEGLKGMERQLAGVPDGAFLQARDPLGSAGFQMTNGTSVAVRHQLGPVGLTVGGERGAALEVDGRRFTPDGRGLGGESRYTLSSVGADASLANFQLGLGASRVVETETVLGGRFSTALGGGGAATTFLDGSVARDLLWGWRGEGRYRRGWTRFAGGDGKLATTGWSFDLSKAGLVRTGDSFGLRVSQPLRVAKGGLDLELPTSWDWRTGEVTYADYRLNMAPQGRELAMEASYGLELGGGWLGANAFWRREPGHFESAPDDLGAAVRFNLRF